MRLCRKLAGIQPDSVSMERLLKLKEFFSLKPMDWRHGLANNMPSSYPQTLNQGLLHFFKVDKYFDDSLTVFFLLRSCGFYINNVIEITR